MKANHEEKFTHLDLFSGIGGFAIAVDSVWEGATHVFCDNNKFCQQVLKKHWPQSKIYSDIRTLKHPSSRDANGNARELPKQDELKKGEGSEVGIPEFGGSNRIHLLTGGFPCQPFSQAGKRKGKEDDRYLWPEMLRVIREFKPDWIIGENVAGIISMALDQVCADLEDEGYEVQPFVIPACAKNAPHRRDRVWICAHNKNIKQDSIGTDVAHNRHGYDEGKVLQGKAKVKNGAGNAIESEQPAGRDRVRPDRHSDKLNAQGQRKERDFEESFGLYGGEKEGWDAQWPEVASQFCRVDDGLPKGLDTGKRLHALGNAIVPQVAVEIMKAIKQINGTA